MSIPLFHIHLNNSKMGIYIHVNFNNNGMDIYIAHELAMFPNSNHIHGVIT